MRKFVGVLLGATAGSILLSATPVPAQAPAQLRGKSVVASWTEERVQRVSGETDFSSRSVPQTLSVYISNEGRVFAKRTAVSSKGGGGMRPRGSGSRESVGEDSAANQGGHVSGHTLTVANKLAGGARMARIEFNQDFSSCTANVILGREGADTIARGRSLISGQELEIKSAKVSGTSCSVQNGNVFGN
jgi:hypothetical protein